MVKMTTPDGVVANGGVVNTPQTTRKWCQINPTLISVKFLLLTFYGALGCLFPFLTLHMQHIGLNHSDITYINTFLPLTALIGPPLASMFADKSGRHKLITIICMLCAAGSYFSLLYIPAINYGRPGLPPVQLWCDERGSDLAVQPCGYKSLEDPCTDFNVNQLRMISAFRVERCRYFCPNETSSFASRSDPIDYTTEAPTNSPNTYVAPVFESSAPRRPPHICFYDASGAEKCKNFLIDDDTSVDFDASLQMGQARLVTEADEENSCQFKQNGVTTSNVYYEGIKCYPETEGCRIVCTATEMRNGTRFLQPEDCQNVSYDHTFTFVLYFILRALADTFPAILISLLDAMIISLVKKHNGDFGRHKMFGLVAVGITSPIVGTLMDENAVKLHGMSTYAPVFSAYVVLMLLSAAITAIVPFTQEAQVANMFKSIKTLLREKELIGLFFVMLSLGSFFNYLETFLYIYLSDLGAPKLLIGLTITVGIVPSIPFLFKSDKILDICGHHNLLILAFIMYGVRFTGFAFLSNPWWAMPLEALELFTLNLVQVVSATLTYNIVSEGVGVVATAQGVVWLAHFVLGRSLGAIIGGVLIDNLGMKPTFCVFAASSIVIAIFYCIIYYSLKYMNKKRTGRHHTKPTTRQPPVIMNNNANVANGNYQPIPLQERI